METSGFLLRTYEFSESAKRLNLKAHIYTNAGIFALMHDRNLASQSSDRCFVSARHRSKNRRRCHGFLKMNPTFLRTVHVHARVVEADGCVRGRHVSVRLIRGK